MHGVRLVWAEIAKGGGGRVSCPYLTSCPLPWIPVLRIHDMDGMAPDPRIHTSDSLVRFRIRMRIRILLFSSGTFKTPTKYQFKKSFSAWYFFEGTFTSFFKDKNQKESQNSRNQGFSYYFCLMIVGSGSGSRRPQNIRIWQIRNTDGNKTLFVWYLQPTRCRDSE